MSQTKIIKFVEIYFCLSDKLEASRYRSDTTLNILPLAEFDKMSDEKAFSKALEKFTVKGEFRSLTIYHNGEELVVAGDKEVVKFVTEKEENLTLREIKEKIEELSQSEEDHRYQRRRSYPRLPVQFKSKGWDWKIARKVLHDYMGVEGFGKGSAKSYGKFKDQPDNWPDTISWIGFKGPTNLRLDSCNEIIQSFLEGRHIDPYTYHDDPTDRETEENEDDATQTDDNAGKETDKAKADPLTLDETGEWYWCYETQQWFPLTLDDTRNWFWSYGKQVWLPYSPPELNVQEGDDNTQEPQIEAEALQDL